MIPDNMLEELSPARSYGLLEDWGAGKTEVDQSDGDDDYYLACAELYVPASGLSYRMDET